MLDITCVKSSTAIHNIYIITGNTLQTRVTTAGHSVPFCRIERRVAGRALLLDALPEGADDGDRTQEFLANLLHLLDDDVVLGVEVHTGRVVDGGRLEEAASDGIRHVDL